MLQEEGMPKTYREAGLLLEGGPVVRNKAKAQRGRAQERRSAPLHRSLPLQIPKKID